MRIVSDTSEPG